MRTTVTEISFQAWAFRTGVALACLCIAGLAMFTSYTLFFPAIADAIDSEQVLRAVSLALGQIAALVGAGSMAKWLNERIIAALVRAKIVS